MKLVDLPPQVPQWDGDWQLIEYDPHTNTSDWWLYDESAGTATIRTVQHDVDALLDQNTALRNGQAGARWGDGKKVASIPANVFNRLGLDDALANGDRKHIRRILNDSDYSKFRTFEGNL